MKQIIAFFAISLFVLTSVVYVFADIARPKPSATVAREGKIVLHTGLTIVPDAKKYEARLQIPESELKSLREALASVDPNPSMMQRVAHSSKRTVIAGIFLFLSISFAGVWLARSQQRRVTKVVAGLVLCAAVIGTATVVTRANAGPPGSYLWRNLPKSLSEGKETSGGVDIEIVPEGYGIKLIVPLKNSKNSNGDEE